MKDLLANPERAAELEKSVPEWPSWSMNSRQLCDLELLLNGSYAPLCGFMSEEEYDSCLDRMRLPGGALWPIPVLLDVDESLKRALEPGASLVLNDLEGVPAAVLRVKDIWRTDLAREAQSVYGTTSPGHPGVARLKERSDRWIVGGPVEGIRYPRHYDFSSLRGTPAELRKEIARLGWESVVGFPTTGLIHRTEFRISRRIIEETGGGLLVQPIVDSHHPAESEHYSRIRCYRHVLRRYPEDRAMLSLLTLSPRRAGIRETVWLALIEKNCGCTHMIARREDEEAFGNRKRAGRIMEDLSRHAGEIGIVLLPGRIDPSRIVPRRAMFPEVVRELDAGNPKRGEGGFTVFFTGLSGSGKSTIASMLRIKLLERDPRRISFLDGDLVRRNLSSELGYSREHRDINIRRIGFVASEITKNGGIAICAQIAPYDSVRREVRRNIEAVGGFLLVHVDTPIEICEKRDRKGLYAKARAGILPAFTGVSDPYEPPRDAEVVLRAVDVSAEDCADRIIEYLEREGYLARGIER